MSAELAEQVRRRRTFAIISHPDAGKTTLTEKLLLFSGAIQIAGSVKARKASRHATSDWMEIEKQRGISVASSVMQMEYRDCTINLLDTPGHQDFSEDTYRVLTAVDAALMVIDAANGVEPQTRRLLQVCRARNTPILTFVNKMDREVQDPLALMDEIERELGMTVVPFTWPVGMGKFFGGVLDLRKDQMRVFSPGEDRVAGTEEIIRASQPGPGRALRHGLRAGRRRDRAGARSRARVRPCRVPGRPPDADVLRLGRQQLRRAGGAGRPGGPGPGAGPARGAAAHGEPDESKFTGVVFKIQANMDPAHRDRIAFLRVASGKFSAA
jgi:peptide chain release factor 3